MSSYFYSHASKNSLNAGLLDDLESYAEENGMLIYVLDKPLTDQKYSYNYTRAVIVLSPRHKVVIINYGVEGEEFTNFVEDVIEDVGSIADKYAYKDVIGRPRNWRSSLLAQINLRQVESVTSLLKELRLQDDFAVKKLDLLISLFIGSINDIDRVKADVPLTLLDKVKQKIQLFDGDQTRFIYEEINKKKVLIQGLSGTGKTELLLHKLKDLYTADHTSKIFFTCHNKILADSLKKRIPNFFNFMRVEQQIEWNKRLWCESAWGSYAYPNSGAYRYICAFYQIAFFRYSYQMSFSRACKLAIDEIKQKYQGDSFQHAFTYMFVDESQDFDESFFELCALVTEKVVYVAGDIFQSIFDENISSTIEPDFLLGKCYRTDPKTLMFAHGIGMGLFEKNKLRWLEQKEWEDCGYNVVAENKKYYLSREPLRRFEDLDDNFESIRIVETKTNLPDTVLGIIKALIKENETVKPDDIGIIFLDKDDQIYQLADIIEFQVQSELRWNVNKAYETKEKRINSILISNRNNVKGLEFPFVICVTNSIKSSPIYRNAVYTMLTRSFIKSFLVLPASSQSGLTQAMKEGLLEIINNKHMVIEEPSEKEKETIRTRFKYNLKKLSHYDLMMEIFKKLKIERKYFDKLLQATQQMDMIESDEETLTEFVKDNLKYIKTK